MISEREALRPLGQSYPVDFSDQSLRSIVKISAIGSFSKAVMVMSLG